MKSQKEFIDSIYNKYEAEQTTSHRWGFVAGGRTIKYIGTLAACLAILLGTAGMDKLGVIDLGLFDDPDTVIVEPETPAGETPGDTSAEEIPPEETPGAAPAFNAEQIDAPVITSLSVAGGSVVLEWSSIEGADKYEVYSILPDGDVKLLETLKDRTYTFKGEKGTDYTFAVKAVMEDGEESEFSEEKSVSIPG